MSAGTPKTTDSMTPNSDVRLWTLSLWCRSKSVMFGSHGDGMDGQDPEELELNTLTVIQSREYFCLMIVIGNSLKQKAISTGSTKNQPRFSSRRQHRCSLELLPSANPEDGVSRSAVSATSSGDVIVAYRFRSRCYTHFCSICTIYECAHGLQNPSVCRVQICGGPRSAARTGHKIV